MWDIKYRPLRFGDVLGQEGSVRVLKSRLQQGSGLGTSYLFSGGHGQGKTTLARILARALLCQQLGQDAEPCNACDNCLGILNGNSEAYTEQDAASRGTIDNMRSIVNDLPFLVPGAPKRVYLFDEAHRMSKDAQDVLLKPIEDKKLVVMFCTTEPEKIRGPIRSRCEDYVIRKVTREDIAKRMMWVLQQENVSFEEDAVLTVVDFSAGHVRDVLNRLEMIAQMGAVTVDAVREHLDLKVITLYYEILLALGDPTRSVPLVEQVCDRVGADEAATGLAEAAMNAFRLAHGMYADFALVDRQLGERVAAMYGADVIRLADYFLQSYRPSRVSLVCDVVRCAGGVPTPRAAGPTIPPVVVAGPARSAPAPVELPSAAPPQEGAQPEPAQETTPPPVKTPSRPLPDKARADSVAQAGFVGGLGSGDPNALTDLDHKAVRETLPRGALRVPEDKRPRVVEPGVQVDLIPATQWRHEFEEAWRGVRGGNTGGV